MKTFAESLLKWPCLDELDIPILFCSFSYKFFTAIGANCVATISVDCVEFCVANDGLG